MAMMRGKSHPSGDADSGSLGDSHFPGDSRRRRSSSSITRSRPMPPERSFPWYSPDPGEAYNHMILKIWEFWKNMKSCPNGVKYYLQHQVWNDPEEDPRGLGGDQLAMALSSWNLLYAYTGDQSVVENMQFIADYYIAHGLSKPTALWPNLFYPYNMELHSGVYDGDMRAGKGVLQPDKAASFAAELVALYKITGNAQAISSTAVAVADTLAKKITPGDQDHPPWPYRVNAETGEVKFSYTTNYTGALRLFDDLIALRSSHAAEYARARDMLTAWLQKYPIKEQKWGPFFEDVGEWSDTEINADTMAWLHPGASRLGRELARGRHGHPRLDVAPCSGTTRGTSSACCPRTNRPPTACRATATPRGTPRWT